MNCCAILVLLFQRSGAVEEGLASRSSINPVVYGGGRRILDCPRSIDLISTVLHSSLVPSYMTTSSCVLHLILLLMQTYTIRPCSKLANVLWVMGTS